MTTSNRGIEAIIAFEGIELEAYKCPGGVWTIGVGHTGFVDGEPVRRGMTITEPKAEELLRADLAEVEKYLNRQPFTAKLMQGQFDALVSFIFNVGKSAFQTSTMRKKLCMGADAAEVSKEFGRWVYGTADGKKVVLPGLAKRRKLEAEMYMSE